MWKYKPKQFVQLNTRFERKCHVNRALTNDEHLSWMIYYHNGRRVVIEQMNFIIESFRMNDEGIAICQIKNKHGEILDEKYVLLSSDRKRYSKEN